MQAHPSVAHLMRAAERFTGRLGSQFSAGITYFSVLALVPLMMLGFSFTGFFLTQVAQDLPSGSKRRRGENDEPMRPSKILRTVKDSGSPPIAENPPGDVSTRHSFTRNDSGSTAVASSSATQPVPSESTAFGEAGPSHSGTTLATRGSDASSSSVDLTEETPPPATLVPQATSKSASDFTPLTPVNVVSALAIATCDLHG